MNKKLHHSMALPEILDASAADGLFHVLSSKLNESEEVSLDAGAVSRISTPCLQILMAAQLHCAANNTAFHITSPSSCFSAAADDLGLQFTS